MTPTTNVPSDPAPVPPAQRLSPEMQVQLEQLLERIARARMPGEPTPPPTETPEEWVARFHAWVDSHPTRGVVADDSRESIYGDDGR